MLSGLLKVSDGNITINRLDISEDIDDIRSLLGVCQQDDIIFEKLTAKEHLYIFGIIKGLEFKEIEKEISNVLNEVGLTDCENELCGNFSGGMKRKLSIASIF